MQLRHDLRPLTSARGIAAWYVVLYHIRDSAAGRLPAGAGEVLAKGYLAVDFFFVLSGFVIWLNYGRMLREQRWGAVPRFLWRRIARIYPLHLLMLVAAVGFALACLATGRGMPAGFDWGTLPWHVLLLQNWGLIDQLGWNVPAWSISCELAAYLLFSLVAVGLGGRRLPSGVLVAVLALLMLALWGLFAAFGKPLLGNDIPHLGLPRCLLEFGMGTIVAALWLRWRAAGRLAGVAAGLGVAGGLAAYAAGVAETLALPLVFSALVLLLALVHEVRPHPNPVQPLFALSGGQGCGRTPKGGGAYRWDRLVMGGRVIHWLGEISYATYMVHALLFLLFKILFVRDAGDVPLPLLGLFLVLVLGASAVLHHGVERPAQRWLNRRGASPNQPVVAE